MSTPATTSTTSSSASSSCDNVDLRLIPEFSGDGTCSVQEWLEKIELICHLRGVSRLENIIPLRLSGSAFAVYQQLSSGDKSSVSAIKTALIGAFGIDKFSAYELFVSRKLKAGESVDVFLAELRKLASAFGGVSDDTLACAFVAGLPEASRRLLRAGARIESMSIFDIVLRARTIVTDSESPPLCAAGRSGREQTCFECGMPNHIAKNCLRRRATQSTHRLSTDERPNVRSAGGRRRCFRCNSFGHLIAACPENGSGETVDAPASSPTNQ